MKHEFKGSHVLAEFYNISNNSNDKTDLKKCLENCCREANVTLLKFDFVEFENGGYTAFALLAESHISIHTYPEYQSVFVDVFTCGNSNTQIIIDILSDYYLPAKREIRSIERGKKNT